MARFPGAIDRPGDGFAHDGPHGAADEAVLHGAEDHGMRSEPAQGVQDCVVEAGFLLRFAQALLVRLEVGEFEGIGGTEAAVHQFVTGLEEHLNALAGAEFEVMMALGADVQVGGQIGLPDGLAAAHTLDPQAFRTDRFGFVAVGVRPGPPGEG